MAKDYGLDVGAALGGLGTTLDATGVQQTTLLVNHLQSGIRVGYAELDQVLSFIKSRLNNPTYARSSPEVIEAIYRFAENNVGQTSQIQAHVLGNIMEEFPELARDLLNHPDAGTLLRQALSDQGMQLLESIIGVSSNVAIPELIGFYQARNIVDAAIRVGVPHELKEKEKEDDESLTGGSPPDTTDTLKESVQASIQSSELEPLKAELAQNTNPGQVAYEIAIEFGETARPLFQALLNEQDANYSDVGYQGILYLESFLEQNAPTQSVTIDSGGHIEQQPQPSATIDAIALRNLLLDDADSLPYNNLAASFGCSNSALQACLLELIVSQ